MSADLTLDGGSVWDDNTVLATTQLRAGGPAGSAIFDEIRIGTTYEDVTPGLIPEPGTLALLGLGGLLMLPRRRKALA